MDSIEDILKRHNKKKIKNNKASKAFTRVLLSIIFILLSCIYIKLDDKNLEWYKTNILENSFFFTKINKYYEKYLGKIIPNNKVVISPVSSPYNSINTREKYLDGYVINSSKNEAINTLQSGLLVYYGEKENYGKVAIIQGVDGVDIWYGNITDINYQMYDYIEKGSIIGNTIDTKYYLLIKKDNTYLTYEEYIEEA